MQSMTVWIVIGIIGIIFICILSSSLTFYVHLNDGELAVKMGMFGLKFWLLNPNPPEKKRKKKWFRWLRKHKRRKKPLAKEKTVDEKQSPPPLEEPDWNVTPENIKQTMQKTAEKYPKQKRDFMETISMMLEFVKAAFEPVGNLLPRVRITCLTARIAVAKQDAHQTALAYAQTSAAIYYLLGNLKNRMTVKVKKLEIYADFVTEESHQTVFFKMKIRLGILIYHVLGIFKNIFVNHIREKAFRKEESL